MFVTCKYFKISVGLLISERRRETPREASRLSTQRAFCHSHMGKENNIITREILILAMWFIEQKVILFRCGTDVRDEPARPSPARPRRSLTAYFSNLLRDTHLKLSHNKVTVFKIVVSNFHRDDFNKSEVIAFFCENRFLPFLHTFLPITQEPLNILKIWLSHVKERSKIYQNHYRFYFKKKFYKV